VDSLVRAFSSLLVAAAVSAFCQRRAAVSWQECIIDSRYVGTVIPRRKSRRRPKALQSRRVRIFRRIVWLWDCLRIFLWTALTAVVSTGIFWGFSNNWGTAILAGVSVTSLALGLPVHVALVMSRRGENLLDGKVWKSRSDERRALMMWMVKCGPMQVANVATWMLPPAYLAIYALVYDYRLHVNGRDPADWIRPTLIGVYLLAAFMLPLSLVVHDRLRLLVPLSRSVLLENPPKSLRQYQGPTLAPAVMRLRRRRLKSLPSSVRPHFAHAMFSLAEGVQLASMQAASRRRAREASVEMAALALRLCVGPDVTSGLEVWFSLRHKWGLDALSADQVPKRFSLLLTNQLLESLANLAKNALYLLALLGLIYLVARKGEGVDELVDRFL